MNKENEQSFEKESSFQFLPVVGKEIAASVSRRIAKNPEKSINESLSQINQENPGFYKFLSWEAGQYSRPQLFLLGSSFVHLSLLEKYREIKKPLPKISPAIFEHLSNKILETDEIYQKKFSDNFKKMLKIIEDNFQVNKHFDENSQTAIFEVKINQTDDIEKFNQLMKNPNEEFLKLIDEFQKRISLTIPSPDFYNKENYSLMKYIKFFGLYILRPKTAASSFLTGSMLTYEVLRRQAESDFLEKGFSQSK